MKDYYYTLRIYMFWDKLKQSHLLGWNLQTQIPNCLNIPLIQTWREQAYEFSLISKKCLIAFKECKGSFVLRTQFLGAIFPKTKV
jgi:hypothetical protein